MNLHVCVSQCFEGTEGCVGYASLQVTQSLEQTVPECQTAPDPVSPPRLPQAGCWSWGLEPRPGLSSSAPTPRRGLCLASTFPGPGQVASHLNQDSWLDNRVSQQACDTAGCQDEPCCSGHSVIQDLERS